MEKIIKNRIWAVVWLGLTVLALLSLFSRQSANPFLYGYSLRYLIIISSFIIGNILIILSLINVYKKLSIYLIVAGYFLLFAIGMFFSLNVYIFKCWHVKYNFVIPLQVVVLTMYLLLYYGSCYTKKLFSGMAGNPERIAKFFFYMVALATVVIGGMLMGQFYLWERLWDRVETYKSRDYINRRYQDLRRLRPEKRPVLYPARSAFELGRDTLETFKERFRTNINQWIGIDEELLKRKVQLRTLGRQKLDSGKLVREEVEFSFEGNELWSLRGYLIYPDAAKNLLPGVVCLNGHNSTARDVAGLERSYTHSYGLDLARAGFKVLAFDWCFEGNSRLADLRGRPVRICSGLIKHMNETGRSGTALYMENAYCALQALKSDPNVDPEKIGVTGISRGGELTCYFAALFAPEIAAYYASGTGFPLVYRRFGKGQEGGGGCECTYNEKVFDNYEFSDLLTAAAPLPGRVQLGIRDPIHGYWDTIEELLKKVQPLYDSLGIPEYFGLDVHMGAHEYYSPQALAFFKKHLIRPKQ